MQYLSISKCMNQAGAIYSQPGENLLEAVSLHKHAGPQVLVSLSWSVETVQEFGGRVLTAARLQLRRECFIFVGVMVAWPGKGSSVFVHRQVVICYHFCSCVASHLSLALSASRNENWLWFHLLKKSGSCWTSVAWFFLSVSWQLLSGATNMADKRASKWKLGKIRATKSVVSLLCHTYVLGTVWVARSVA